eukprot:10040433-Lingulodinium_polyedra.AAC.1
MTCSTGAPPASPQRRPKAKQASATPRRITRSVAPCALENWIAIAIGAWRPHGGILEFAFRVLDPDIDQ